MDQSLLPNIFDFLSRTDPFDTLSPEEREKLAASVDISYLAQGDKLDGSRIVGTGLYMVRTGAVEQRYPDGALRARLGSGDLFGFSQMHRHGECEYALVALENTLLYLIPRQVLDRLIAENPAVSHYFAATEGVRLASSKQNDIWGGNNSLYLSTVGSTLNRTVVRVTPDMLIREAAQEMVRLHRSSALVMDGDTLVGIVTDRDMTKRVVAEGLDISLPVSSVMTEMPVAIDSEAPLIRAVEQMMQHNVRSLPVLENGKVAGVMTATSLVQKSQIQAVYLISRIYRQESIADLKILAVQRQSVYETLVENGVHPRTVLQMMTLIADAFNKRLLQLGERELGSPPCDYAWIVAGSHARNEMHCLSDQDSGIVLGCEPDEHQRRYFQALAEFVCNGMDECGYPLCTGHMMATHSKWCNSLQGWQSHYREWVMQPEAESLLNISVFLDTRFLYGNEKLAEMLRATVQQYTRDNRRFLAVLVANSLRVNPPLGMFRQFVLAKDGENRNVFNIKKQAINLLVELARIYALAANSGETGTEERLDAAAAAGVISEESRKELTEAFHFICQVRFHHQRSAIGRGEVASNNIVPAWLTQFERNHLKDAFRIIARTQEAAMQRFSARGVLR